MINRKLIGARYFYEGFKATSNVSINASFNSARDYAGHGTHTLSTAAGNFVPGVSVFGNGNGTASGAAPKARVVSYKVCWEGSDCNDADVLAAFEAAITDGVDVINLSLAGDDPKEYFNNSLSIGSFHAVVNGLVVVSAAGNDGPKPSTVLNFEPWVITVAASRTNRDFINTVTLGDNTTLKGMSLSMSGLSSDKLYQMINASNANTNDVTPELASVCLNKTHIDPEKVKGKILICNTPFLDQTWAEEMGAVGVIYPSINPRIELDPKPLTFPTSNLRYSHSKYFLSYMNSTK
ncbi:unnamed protein product [Lupinus luteus]|uniref:Peptidase S8/S53 domain-containing protein n=1 Tax=Lupinus luteus TaxID=3873 RepID=A0AAV1YJP8_LUPLU